MSSNGRRRRFFVVVALISFTLLGTVAIDRVVGLFIPRNPNSPRLIFAPHAEAVYKSVEFTFVASINDLGFRDRDFSLSKTANQRVLAIGDSFTYGWGVRADQSWPKVLERNLRARGLDIEIANLGWPGRSPIDYANAAEQAIPLLRPDLVVVAVLQGDDLAQLKPRQPRPSTPTPAGPERSRLRTALSHLLHKSYPNLLSLARTITQRSPAINQEWQREAKSILAEFNADERRHFERLDKLVKHAFLTGELNPYLIHTAIKDPRYFLQTFDLTQSDVKILIDEMATQLHRIKAVAAQHNARVLVVAVPFGIYVSPIEFETWREYGFLVDDDMLVSDSPDQAIRMASQKVGLPFVTVTDRFREHRGAHFFYELDGHFDVSGHQFYADQLTPILNGMFTEPSKP